MLFPRTLDFNRKQSVFLKSHQQIQKYSLIVHSKAAFVFCLHNFGHSPTNEEITRDGVNLKNAPEQKSFVAYSV